MTLSPRKRRSAFKQTRRAKCRLEYEADKRGDIRRLRFLVTISRWTVEGLVVTQSLRCSLFKPSLFRKKSILLDGWFFLSYCVFSSSFLLQMLIYVMLYKENVAGHSIGLCMCELGRRFWRQYSWENLCFCKSELLVSRLMYEWINEYTPYTLNRSFDRLFVILLSLYLSFELLKAIGTQYQLID